MLNSVKLPYFKVKLTRMFTIEMKYSKLPLAGRQSFVIVAGFQRSRICAIDEVTMNSGERNIDDSKQAYLNEADKLEFTTVVPVNNARKITPAACLQLTNRWLRDDMVAWWSLRISPLSTESRGYLSKRPTRHRLTSLSWVACAGSCPKTLDFWRIENFLTFITFSYICRFVVSLQAPVFSGRKQAKSRTLKSNVY